MLKQLFDYLQQSLLLVHDVQQNRRDLEELRRELKVTNSLVIELSHKLERLSERERLEREKMALPNSKMFCSVSSVSCRHPAEQLNRSEIWLG